MGNEHTITLNENSNKVYSSGKFDFDTVSIPLVLNKTRKFIYFEANVNVDDPKFVMERTVTIKETISALQNITSDAVGFFMIPERGSNKHISDLTGNRIEVLDKFIFKDLHGGQKGTGTNEILLLVGGKDGQGKLISTLQMIAPELPYS